MTDVKERLRGVAGGLLTPFDADGTIRHEHIAENARALYDRGLRTFLAAANISEYHALSYEERVDVVETSVDALPEDACVLAGVGGPLAEATGLAERYGELGADATMVMPPDFTYMHRDGLVEYYRKLAAASPMPTVPYARGFEPTPDLLAEIARIDGVVGVKYAVDDVPLFAEAVATGPDDVVWVDGMAEPHAVALWANGAEGFTAGVSNFRPEVGLALYDALDAGDYEHAREIQALALPFQRFRGTTGEGNTFSGGVSVAAVKRGLERTGLHGGHLRPPLSELSEADRARADELYDELDAGIERVIEG
jgi:4-hydroxy-tetrahydrodipicolinate synthase